jgi:hypothetical protein
MYNFTIDLVHEENEKLYKAFHKKYPTDKARLEAQSEWSAIQETVRGLYVMEKWNREGRSGSPVSLLSFYSMPTETMNNFISTYLPNFSDDVTGIVKTEKRKDKWSNFDAWSKEHQGEQFTTDHLTEVAGFSYQTVLKYISESPLFGKIKKGIWEVLVIPDRDK